MIGNTNAGPITKAFYNFLTDDMDPVFEVVGSYRKTIRPKSLGQGEVYSITPWDTLLSSRASGSKTTS
ncbi:uncharacterized protein PG986_002742 [Apiospora aurea]|uniref:Uncharacterized protein n=1 Tax=Apiospora aurea TaxID=335848 RepID=A0ABR1QQJ9_9PEZI